MTEVEHIQKNTAGETPHGLYWSYEVRVGGDSFSHIVQVMTIIASQPVVHWPDDDRWLSLLPDWFRASFKQYSLEEAQELLKTTPRKKWSTLPWDFGSWLDAMKNRGWLWWSSETNGQRMRIYLSIQQWPASLEAFEHILVASGADIISRHEQA
jgi:hypothetical protein